MNNTTLTPPQVGEIITVQQLIDRANEALQEMENIDPHKLLIYNMANAIVALTGRLDEAERKLAKQEPSKLVLLPGGSA